jgi:hypothetical protein
MAKSRQLEWLFCFRTIDYEFAMHRMDNAICFTNNGTKPLIIKYSRFMRLYCTYFSKRIAPGAKVLLV